MNILSLGLCIKFIIVQEKTTPSVIVGNDYHLHPTELGSKEKQVQQKFKRSFGRAEELRECYWCTVFSDFIEFITTVVRVKIVTEFRSWNL